MHTANQLVKKYSRDSNQRHFCAYVKVFLLETNWAQIGQTKQILPPKLQRERHLLGFVLRSVERT